MQRSSGWIGIWIVIAALNTGMASSLPKTPGMPSAPAAGPSAPSVYDQLYPSYAEFCAATQIRKKPGFGLPVRGGVGGHGVLYLRGACRDKTVGYPRITLCDPVDGANGVEPGVGVSVNSDFQNVNWTAVDTKAFFLTGDLKPGERLDREAYVRARQKAVDIGVLKGIEFHPELFSQKLTGMSDFEFMLEDTMGTDYAISFGRNLYCARLPVTRPMLSKMVDWLNEQNDQYYLTGKRYQWSGVKDNCTHTTHNAYHAADVWGREATNRFLLRQIFHIAVPSHNFVELMERGNRLPLEDPVALYRDPSFRRSLLHEGWIPAQHGVLAEVFPVIKDNDLYETDLGMLFLGPEGLLKRGRFKKILGNTRMLDLEENLRWYKARYEKALRTRQSVDSIFASAYVNEGAQDTLSDIDREDFALFHDAYYRQLAIQLRDAELKLQLFGRKTL